MTTIHRDDITEKEYSRDGDMIEFGVAQDGMALESFDVFVRTIHDDPEAIADRLHESVDEWLRETKEEIDAERD